MAVSIKENSPGVTITLFHDDTFNNELLDWQKGVFDRTIRIPENIMFNNGVFDPANIKINAYDYFVDDYTLFIDVDMFAMRDINAIFDELIADGGYYYSHVIGQHNISQGREIPTMYWAFADDIWNHYQLPDDAILPSTNSSFQFVRKCDESDILFAKIRENYSNPIPISRLRNQWGGTQPDELYLNVALAQIGLIPKTPRKYMWMANESPQGPLSNVYDRFELLCLFGNRAMIKPLFTSWIDRELVKMHSKSGKQHFYKWHKIVGDKHANKKVNPIHQSQYRDDILVPRRLPGRVVLIVAFYTDKNESRNKELRSCLFRNIECKSIDEIHLVCDQRPEIDDSILYSNGGKVFLKVTDSRQTFDDIVGESNFISDDSSITIVSNADIYFDDRSVQLIKSVNLKKYILALSRWDVKQDGTAKHYNYEWSQDCWVWAGKIATEKMDLNFPFGKMQCDNRFAYELNKIRPVINPSFSIKTYHKHLSGVRNYQTSDRVGGDLLPVKAEPVHPYIKKRMLLIQPGKVGDIILCLPIAKHYSSEFIVDWLCPKRYHNIFDSIDYAHPVEVRASKYDRVIDIAFGLGGAPEKFWHDNKHKYDSFVTLKYELAGVPIENKTNLIWERNREREKELFEMLCGGIGEYVLVHRSSDYGTPISVDRENVVEFKPVEGFTIFDWYLVIVNASEIHCIDSSLCNFIDAIPDAKSIKKYWYKTDKVPNKYDETILTNNWERIEQ